MAEKKSKAYELGFDHARMHLECVERYNMRPPSQKPDYPKDSQEDKCDRWVWS